MHTGPSFGQVVLLGLAFMLIFAGFQSSTFVITPRLDAAYPTSDNSSTTLGSTGIAIMYAINPIAFVFTPAIVTKLGPKISMFAAALLYTAFLAELIHPVQGAFYATAVLMGFATSLLWQAQGIFYGWLCDFDNRATSGAVWGLAEKYQGVFWSLMQVGLFLGGTIVYVVIGDEKNISVAKGEMLYAVFTGSTLLGTLLVLVLRPRTPTRTEGVVDPTFRQVVRGLDKPLLLLIMPMFAFTGIEKAYWWGTLNQQIKDDFTSQKIGLALYAVGAAQIVGGLLPLIVSVFRSSFTKAAQHDADERTALLGQKAEQQKTAPLWILFPSGIAFAAAIVIVYLWYIARVIPSDIQYPLIAAFLFGFGDSLINSLTYAMLKVFFNKHEYKSLVAIFKGLQSLSLAACFLYANVLSIRYEEQWSCFWQQSKSIQSTLFWVTSLFSYPFSIEAQLFIVAGLLLVAYTGVLLANLRFSAREQRSAVLLH
eukprot:m.718530 g.718530  ORF g.718530 m.718530 type:complete len:481 (-) comp58809_c1_seq40:2998-4440(-)